MALLDIAALKARLDITKTTSDSLLQAILDGALDFAAGETRRQLGILGGDPGDPPVTVDRYPNDDRLIRVPDARQVTGLTVDGAASTAWRLIGRQPAGTTPYPWVRLDDRTSGHVQITGKFGFATLPPALADAVLTHAARHYRERDALYGDIVTLDDGATVHFGKTLPARVRAVYTLYRITRAGALSLPTPAAA